MAGEEVQSCTIPYGKDGNIGIWFAIKKSESFFNFFLEGYQSTRFRVFSRYFAPVGLKASSAGQRKNDNVLLHEKRQSITFVREGCIRNLSGASGQTAL
jgi:hypothetical protein